MEPKESPDELYDFEEELKRLEEGYKSARLVAVLGPRRTGKSSLLRTFLNGWGVPHIYIDARRAAIERGYATRRGFLKELSAALSAFLARSGGLRDRLLRRLRGITGVSVSVSPVSVSLSWGREPPSVTSLLDAVDEAAEEEGVKVVLAIDEVQELRGAVDVASLLAYIYDNLPHIVAAVTGSQVGLVYDVLRLEDPDSPLYGRALYEVRPRRLSREEALEFLRLGFQQAGMQVAEEELERAVDALDGIIGWLAYYGWSKATGAKSLEEIVDTAARQEAAELQRLFAKSRAERRYRAILKAAALRPMRWSELKRAVEVEEGAEVDDHNFTKLLQNLVRLGLLEKQEGAYRIPDPVVRAAVEKYI